MTPFGRGRPYLLLFLLAPGVAHAQQDSVRIVGALTQTCAISYDCGGSDRCNQLRLEDRVNAQDTVEVTISCNFAGDGATIELRSLNSGALRAPRDNMPLDYFVSLSGISGSEVTEQQLSVPLRVSLRPETPARDMTGMVRVRIDDRRESLVADRYTDRVSITILPES
ncbi:hypothetical protein [Stakelama tenebrarum]|uniref:Spore coat protein U domain-containing protein n=1 Tax=Stakelama tenebrarum TaxID=2711215 RepID=A0A6G6Y2H2_9SPHN|nr:hypothetical protein [Sphingosinithalassobacter tenebrarum]QIG79041.1 hypothetical protein G5C33_04080 [Sphingosinithalassobacter tenebrarum]